MKDCDIVRDLLPLYADNSCSEDGRQLVEQHISKCETCRALLGSTHKTVQVMLSHQKAKQSFSVFQRRIMTQRVLLIALCVLIVLIPFGIWAYDAYSTYEAYQYAPRPARIEPIESTISRLSDGSIYLTLQYTDSDVYVNYYSTSRAHMNNRFTDNDIWFDDDGTLYIQPGYAAIYQKDRRNIANNHVPKEFIISTDESYPKYAHYSEQIGNFSHPYTRIVLLGSDGERILWQTGDELPAADITAEAELINHINSLEYINSLSTPDPKH